MNESVTSPLLRVKVPRAPGSGFGPGFSRSVQPSPTVAVTTVVGFPCNQFGGQEPGTAEEISTFCATNYGITFPIMEKIEVNGPNRNDVYKALTPIADASGHTGDIRWNFEKFLIGRDGNVIARFGPLVVPEAPELVESIEKAL